MESDQVNEKAFFFPQSYESFFKTSNLIRSEITNKHVEWKSIRWQRVHIKEANEEAEKQMQALNGLPSESYSWDVYMNTKQEILNIKVN